MKINKVLAELESLVVDSKEDEDRAQRIGYQIEEYKRQEKSLNETIETATAKRLELESALEVLKPTNGEGR